MDENLKPTNRKNPVNQQIKRKNMTTLENYLGEVYTAAELKNVADAWLKRQVSLEQVSDIKQFLEECEAETAEFKKAGPHRKVDWEEGWSGAGITNEFPDFPNIPYYFKKNTHVRVGERLFRDVSGLTELCMLRTIQDVAFSNAVVSSADSVIEYGCGTGHNLVYLKSRVQHELYGADWAQSAVEKLTENKIVGRENAFRVDYFDQQTYAAPNKPFIAFTNASLEQSGANYKKFMNYLFENTYCTGGIHIEPIRELINPINDLNKFSIKYAERRGYLTGFYEFVRESSVRLLVAKDYGIGSKFISGYQLLIWGK